MFENEDHRKVHTKYYFQKVEDYNVTTDENVFLISQLKLIWENTGKIKTNQGDDYTTVSLPDYNYFKKHYKWIAKDLS